MILAKRISENEKKEIINDFLKNKTLEEISEKFNLQINDIKTLEKSLGDKKYSELNKLSKKRN